MTAIDVWAAVAASIASAAIGMRARMLRPWHGVWTEAPRPVWASLSALALALGMGAVSLWFGAHASQREAMIYTVLAGCSVAMLWNLNRHGRQREAERQKLRDDVEAVMQASGEAAIYPWERRSS